MFNGGPGGNPYDDMVSEYLLDHLRSLVIADKTTEQNLTNENWALILNICLKVQEEGPEGARNVVAAVLKRLEHRNPSVQLYALSLADYLFKKCTIDLRREIASQAFTQGLEKMIADRTTHEKVKRRALGLIAMWTAEFQIDPSFGVSSFVIKDYKFETPQEAPSPAVDDELRWTEAEELQRVLEMCFSAAGSSSSAGGSGIGSNLASASSSVLAATASSLESKYKAPTYDAGYVPASPKVQTPVAHVAAPTQVTTDSTSLSVSVSTPAAENNITRVRALYTFEPAEPGELAFEKEDIIKVVDRGFRDWWRGQLKGRIGIFPVNYVELITEPTAAELAKGAEQEAAIFAQAANVDRLLTMLRSLDPAKDNLADNEEIQELYRSSMALRPKIVKLIDNYSQKRAELVSINETFVRARSIFDGAMDESLARSASMVTVIPYSE